MTRTKEIILIFALLTASCLAKPTGSSEEEGDEDSDSNEENNQGGFRQNPGERGDEEAGGYEKGCRAEADTIICPDEEEKLKELAKLMEKPSGKDDKFRNAIGKKYWERYIWANGKVPYDFSKVPGLIIDDYSKNMTKDAMKMIEERTEYNGKKCIQFVQRTNEYDYISYVKKVGCWSSISKRGSKQELSVGLGCGKIGTIAHELLHSMGFYHEQSRKDRDQYIEILWENIQPGKASNFKKFEKTDENEDDLDQGFDFGSLLLYGPWSFTKNRLTKTIVPKVPLPPGIVMGQRTRLSDKDVAEIRIMYGCARPGSGGGNPEVTTKETTTTTTTTTKATTKKKRNRTRTTAATTAATGGTNENTAQQLPEGSTLCNFEKKSDCTFTADESSDFPMEINKGSTPTDGTGPSVDHTKGTTNGRYYYAEATDHIGQTGGILTPQFETGTHCLRFWYHMSGADAGMLQVMKDVPNLSRSQQWKTKGDNGDQWTHKQLTLSSFTPFKVAFVATISKKGADQGDIAIDDVSFSPGKC